MEDETLGQFIFRHRKLRGLTQEDLARSVGITKAYVCIIERGDQTGRDVSVSPAKLSAVASALGVPAEDLFNRAGILPEGTVLVRNTELDQNPGDKEGSTKRRENAKSNQSMRDWSELVAVGYSDLPPNAREEVKRFIEFRSHQIKSLADTTRRR